MSSDHGRQRSYPGWWWRRGRGDTPETQGSRPGTSWLNVKPYKRASRTYTVVTRGDRRSDGSAVRRRELSEERQSGGRQAGGRALGDKVIRLQPELSGLKCRRECLGLLEATTCRLRFIRRTTTFSLSFLSIRVELRMRLHASDSKLYTPDCTLQTLNSTLQTACFRL